MLSHSDVLQKLRQTFPGDNGCTLVARYVDDRLKLPARRTHIFIGDCHMLSDHDAAAYPKARFEQEEDLTLLLQGLTELKADSPGALRVWQLGDLVDIWRARGGVGPSAEVDRITRDHAPIVDSLRYGPPYGVGARILAGNHDYGLREIAEWRAERYRILDNDAPDGGDVFVLHGDVFSWIERLPQEIKERVVRFATWHSSGRRDLFDEAEVIAETNRELDPNKPVGATKVSLARNQPDESLLDRNVSINVIDGDGGNPNAKNKDLFKAAKRLAEAMKDRGHNIRVMVVGHTHWARLVKGAIKGEPFVLLDCGAWIGSVRLAAKAEWIHSGQIGVLAGNEMRLYQVGWRPVA